MLRAGSSRHPKAAALFLDELANAVSQGHLHPKIEVCFIVWSIKGKVVLFRTFYFALKSSCTIWKWYSYLLTLDSFWDLCLSILDCHNGVWLVRELILYCKTMFIYHTWVLFLEYLFTWGPRFYFRIYPYWLRAPIYIFNRFLYFLDT